MKAVTMPKWPAWLMFAFMAGCAYPAVTSNPTPTGPQTYRALGQEPGWNVTITEHRIDYVGDYGETRFAVPRPAPLTTFNGHRYDARTGAHHLIVDITHVRCNDTMSGHGYANTITVTADGKIVRGCGGERRPDWDM